MPKIWEAEVVNKLRNRPIKWQQLLQREKGLKEEILLPNHLIILRDLLILDHEVELSKVEEMELSKAEETRINKWEEHTVATHLHYETHHQTQEDLDHEEITIEELKDECWKCIRYQIFFSF